MGVGQWAWSCGHCSVGVVLWASFSGRRSVGLVLWAWLSGRYSASHGGVTLCTAGVGKKTPSETSRLAECVGDTRSLLWKILADSHRNLAACHQQGGNNKHYVPEELSKFQVSWAQATKNMGWEL